MHEFAFIGAGNMASSLIGGLIRGGVSPAGIVAADPDVNQLRRVAALGIEVTNDNAEAITGAAAVVLAVKPQVAETVVRDFAARLDSRQLLVSIAAGITTHTLKSWTGGHQAIVRCMPNTPALFGAGITAAYADQLVTPAGRAIVDALMRAAGRGLWVNDEKALDAVTAVSGSGPAYFFYLMETMIDAGIELGLDKETAQTLTLETAKGAATMALASDDPPAVLRRNVTSPGGTTERAISIFEENRLSDIIARAVQGAGERSAELARELGDADQGNR